MAIKMPFKLTLLTELAREVLRHHPSLLPFHGALPQRFGFEFTQFQGPRLTINL